MATGVAPKTGLARKVAEWLLRRVEICAVVLGWTVVVSRKILLVRLVGAVRSVLMVLSRAASSASCVALVVWLMMGRRGVLYGDEDEVGIGDKVSHRWVGRGSECCEWLAA